MKILFDQNISFRVLRLIEDSFPGCAQVRMVNLENATDWHTWSYAKENNYAIATFDSDFSDISSLYGHPPKIIWLRRGNLNSRMIAQLFVKKQELVRDFLDDEKFADLSCLELYS